MSHDPSFVGTRRPDRSIDRSIVTPRHVRGSCARDARCARARDDAAVDERAFDAPATAGDACASTRARVSNGLFGLGLPEIVVIGGVAAVLFGPQKIPELGKSLGKTVKSFQEAAKVREAKAKAKAKAIDGVRRRAIEVSRTRVTDRNRSLIDAQEFKDELQEEEGESTEAPAAIEEKKGGMRRKKWGRGNKNYYFAVVMSCERVD